MLSVKVFEKEREVVEGTSLYELSKEYSPEKGQYVLAVRNGRLSELFKKVKDGDDISFVSTVENAGELAYKRSMTMLMLKAFHDLYPELEMKIAIKHSLGDAFYCRVKGNIKVTKEQLQHVENRMKELVKEDHPIEKHSIQTREALLRFHEYGMTDKERLFRYRKGSRSNLYAIDHYEDYYYGYMVPTTGCLKYFRLRKYEDGFLMEMPSKEAPETVLEVIERPKLFQILTESEKWCDTLEIDTVGALNDAIVAKKMNDLILIQEALQEKKLAELADEIVKNKKKIVLIAGPSSSGKTTFSHRLSIQLKVHGMNPHPIAIDNYFKNREDSPRDENGNYNFEVLEALDVELFQEQMMKLLQGEMVSMPVFNFVTGCREFKGKNLVLDKDDILVIEGIHGLNSKLTNCLPRESIYKIYISALTQINLDEHNRIPTTDGRLIRRIVRDASYRGTSARDTIARWDSVRHGEEHYIFPYQEEADVMFNSALIYELGVLKQYAEPLLYAVPMDCEEYQEAKRLLKFLAYFLGIPSDSIPHNSLIREFIGGNCFDI